MEATTWKLDVRLGGTKEFNCKLVNSVMQVLVKNFCFFLVKTESSVFKREMENIFPIGLDANVNSRMPLWWVRALLAEFLIRGTHI